MDVQATLAAAGHQLPRSVTEPIHQLGREAIPALIDILEDDELAQVDAAGDGHAPIHAATLLRDLRAVEAVPAMLRALARCDAADILYRVLIEALQDMGAPVLEPALAAHAEARTAEPRQAVAQVLAGIRFRDSRVFALLLEELRRDAVRGAMMIAEYGDPAALPHLSAAFDAQKLDPRKSLSANWPFLRLAAAIDQLGGSLTAAQADVVRHVRDAHDQLRAPLWVTPAPQGERAGAKRGTKARTKQFGRR